MIKFLSQNKIGRNDPCPCQSGLKFKHCHGDPIKQEQCKQVANLAMVELIREEQIQRGVAVKKYICNSCNIPFDEPQKSLIVGPEVLLCPGCGGTNFIEREKNET